jgi:uncharacterized protein YqjF (DUF2071 family)
MSVVLQQQVTGNLGEAARRRLFSRRGEPLFVADWIRPVFAHFEVDPEMLAREVPFALDLREGRAYVSVVAFTMRGMRFRFGGRFVRWLCRPIATHDFLNVRTYVRHRGEPGIFFLTEWLSSRLCVRLGPATFGLPYRFARTQYHNQHEQGRMMGEVRGGEGTFRYQARVVPGTGFGPCPEGSLDEFLLERYTAFTSHAGHRRFFRIWHEPWRQTSVELNVIENSLLMERWPWFENARLVGANYSPGATDVLMGWPHRVLAMPARHRSASLFELA